MRDIDLNVCQAIGPLLLGILSCSSSDGAPGSQDASLAATADAPMESRTVVIDVYEFRSTFLRQKPAWIVVQDGEGAFHPVGGDPPYTIDVQDPDGRFGVAVGCLNGYFPVNVYQGTLRDGNTLQFVCFASDIPTHSVAINPEHGSSGGTGCAIGYGDTTSLVCDPSTVDVATGPHDVIGFYDGGESAARAYARREVDQDAITVDFTDAQHSGAASRYSLIGASDWQFSVHYVTLSTRAVQLGPRFVSMPSDLRQESDRYEAKVRAPQGRAAYLSFVQPRDVDARSWPLADLPLPSVAVSGRHLTWVQGPQSLGIRLEMGGDEFGLGAWFIFVSRMRLSGMSAYTIPEFSDVEGYRPEWNISSNLWNLDVYYPLLSATTFSAIANVGGPAAPDELDFAFTNAFGESSVAADAGVANAP